MIVNPLVGVTLVVDEEYPTASVPYVVGFVIADWLPQNTTLPVLSKEYVEPGSDASEPA